MDPIFADLPLWAILLSVLAGLFLAEFAGRAARRALVRRAGHEDAAPSAEGGLDHIVSSVFALFGLLIAFTFSLAPDRYETRRHLVVDEANAIETAYSRAAYAADLETSPSCRHGAHQWRLEPHAGSLAKPLPRLFPAW